MDTCEIVNCSSYIVFVCVCVLMHMCVLEYMPGGHMWELHVYRGACVHIDRPTVRCLYQSPTYSFKIEFLTRTGAHH